MILTNFLYEFQKNDSKLSEQFYPKGNTAINHRQVTIQSTHMVNQTHFGNTEYGNLCFTKDFKASIFHSNSGFKKKKKLKSKEFLSNFSKCKQRFYFKGFFLLLLFLFVLNSRTGKVCLWPCNINPQKSYYINLLLFLQNRTIWIKPRLYWINSHQSLPHLFPLQHDHILKNFPFENLWG